MANLEAITIVALPVLRDVLQLSIYFKGRGTVYFYILFYALCAVYVTAWGLCSLSWLKGNPKMNSWGERLLIMGSAVHILFVSLIFIKLGNFLFESLSGLFILLSLLSNIVHFIVKFYFPKRILNIVFPPIAVLFLVLSVNMYSYFPVFQEFVGKSSFLGRMILYLHVFCTIFGYILFGVSCLASMVFLWQEKRIKNKTLLLKKAGAPSLGFLDMLNYKVIIAGLIFLTVGLFLGINMKILVEGRFDISLRQGLNVFTWGIYVFFVTDRIINGLRGKTTALWAIVGFGASTASLVYEMHSLLSR